ncbi:ATP-grasp domain-containing protein [Streptomyces zaomyceticus]|uniref:ATP-grasp domain-containing protein n=1 Tax=Streptomyces zaomyceticus TaxID=68286 RepID=UPI002E12DA6A|nr:ATP-grasp domain-containing protein [Streptomyces zaomyceticus]
MNGNERTDPEHVVVLHRWRDRHARYAAYLDHRTQRVTYVTTDLGRSSVPEGAAAVRTVRATDDPVETRAAVAELIGRFGPASRLVALNEGDLDNAAELRVAFGLPGQTPAELERFRDKLTMVRLVDAAGVRVPRYADADTAEDVRAFGERHGWPVVVKPRRGTASRGVLLLHSEDELDAQADIFLPDRHEPRIVQSFVSDPVLHIDGLWTGDALGAWRVSRYVNNCEEFTKGTFLGSVEVDEPEVLAPLADFTAAAAEALGDGRPWVFHMEVFLGRTSDGSPRPVFLEAGARVGGGEIPFVWREVHGLDLMSAAADIQLGRTPAVPAVDPEPDTGADTPSAPDATGTVGHTTAGWLLLPLPVPPPCEVESVSWAAGAGEDGPYAHMVPEPGYVIPAMGGYEHVAARFRFRGASSRSVEAQIRKTAESFAMSCRPRPC